MNGALKPLNHPDVGRKVIGQAHALPMGVVPKLIFSKKRVSRCSSRSRNIVVRHSIGAEEPTDVAPAKRQRTEVAKSPEIMPPPKFSSPIRPPPVSPISVPRPATPEDMDIFPHPDSPAGVNKPDSPVPPTKTAPLLGRGVIDKKVVSPRISTGFSPRVSTSKVSSPRDAASIADTAYSRVFSQCPPSFYQRSQIAKKMIQQQASKNVGNQLSRSKLQVFGFDCDGPEQRPRPLSPLAVSRLRDMPNSLVRTQPFTGESPRVSTKAPLNVGRPRETSASLERTQHFSGESRVSTKAPPVIRPQVMPNSLARTQHFRVESPRIAPKTAVFPVSNAARISPELSISLPGSGDGKEPDDGRSLSRADSRALLLRFAAGIARTASEKKQSLRSRDTSRQGDSRGTSGQRNNTDAEQVALDLERLIFDEKCHVAKPVTTQPDALAVARQYLPEIEGFDEMLLAELPRLQLTLRKLVSYVQKREDRMKQMKTDMGLRLPDPDPVYLFRANIG